jgi:hypothetical protein
MVEPSTVETSTSGMKEKMTEHNKYNGDQLYVGGRRREDDSFPEKKITFYFNRPRNPDADARSRRVESLKDFEILDVLEKEPRSARRTSYQADRNGHLPKEKIESPKQMPDRVKNRSARSVGTKKSELDQWST